MNLLHYGLAFHHFGLAVSNIDRARHFLQGLGYKPGEHVHDPLQNINLLWCEHPTMPPVELVSSSGSLGPLDNYLSNMSELMYHLCFEAEDIEASVSAIRNDKVRVLRVASPKPAVLFGGKEVGFYLIKGFGLVELLQR